MTNEAGQVILSYAYDAYGNVLSQIGEDGNQYQYSTKEYNNETGLVYFGARYYDPSIGRFITADPLGIVDGPNLYTYCSNNPVNLVDPWGPCGERSWYEGQVATGVFAVLDMIAGIGEVGGSVPLVTVTPMGDAGLYTLGVMTTYEASVHLEGALTGDYSKIGYDIFDTTMGEFGEVIDWVKSTHDALESYKVLKHPISAGGKAVLKNATELFRYYLKIDKERREYE